MKTATKNLPLLIGALLVAALFLPAQASANMPPLNQTQPYIHLKNYVDWLNGRKGQKANANQRQGFHDTLGNLAQNALAHVNNRHNIRVTGHADAHNAAFHSELIQLERAYVADLDALDQAHTQGANEAKSDYEEQLQQIAADQAAGLEDAKSLLKEEVAAVKEEYADPLSGVNSVIKRSWKRFNRTLDKRSKRTGKKAKAWKKRQRARYAKTKAMRKLYGRASNLQKAQAAEIGEVQATHNGRVAAINAAADQARAKAKRAYNDALAALKAETDKAKAERQNQYSSDVGQTHANYAQAWNETWANLVAAYNHERNVIINLRDTGRHYISVMPH